MVVTRFLTFLGVSKDKCQSTGYYYQSGTFTIAKDHHEIVQKIKEAADALLENFPFS